ncbi:MAG: XdhC family protein [Erythrobacter sp.]
MNSWRLAAQIDDIRAALAGLPPSAEPCAIATLVEVAGSAPREAGAQMLITADEYWGFLSGGCIEDDVARHGREVMASGSPRLLRYGEGSPWIDIKLACGSAITVLIEPARRDEPALSRIMTAYAERRPALWTSDGAVRTVQPVSKPCAFAWDGMRYAKIFAPRLRLVLIGADAAALASAALGRELGFDVVLITPGGPPDAPFAGIAYHRGAAADALASIGIDRWSAIAVLSHEREDNERALAYALRSEAFYTGAIGARARLDARLVKLRAHGVTEAQIARLHAPIGLQGFGKSPREIALSLVAEVAREFHACSAMARSPGASISITAPASSVAR